MDYLEYKKVVESSLNALRLPPRTSESGDYQFTTAGISVYAWTFEWVVKFSDNKYLRVWEQYARVRGLQESRRVRFSFHYGPIPQDNSNGEIRYTPSDPVDIRIDDYRSPAHLHLGAPLPHYEQRDVIGLNLADLSMIAFIRTVLKHRRTGRPIDKILKLKIRSSD